MKKKYSWDRVKIIAKNNVAKNEFMLSIFIDDKLIYTDWINKAKAKDVLPLISKLKNYKPNK